MASLLRLDPGLPPLWRTERILQFGIDPVASVVDPAPWQERFVRELERGIPPSALPVLAAEYGVDVRAVRDFLDQVAPAVAPGTRRSADRVVVEIAADDDTAGALVGALTASGIVPDVVDGDDRTPRLSERSAPRILVAHNALDPGRARAAVREDAPHLPIVFSATRAVVGPLVVPGRTACLACVDAHRYDADPSWPTLLAQLLGRPRAPVAPSLAAEAAGIAAWLIRGGEPVDPPARGMSVVLSASSPRRSWRTHHPHERCGCRSL